MSDLRKMTAARFNPSHGISTEMRKNLRTVLEEITRESVETHLPELEKISSDYPHTIVSLPEPFDEPKGDFNCVMYALELTGTMEYPCRPIHGKFYADTAFLKHLIESGALPPCDEKPESLVVWSSDGIIKHVGVVAEPGRARSKWGIGYLFEHEFLEVPADYGDQIDFFNNPLEMEATHEYLINFINRPRLGLGSTMNEDRQSSPPTKSKEEPDSK